MAHKYEYQVNETNKNKWHINTGSSSSSSSSNNKKLVMDYVVAAAE